MAFDGDVGVVLGQDFSSFALVIEVTIVVLHGHSRWEKNSRKTCHPAWKKLTDSSNSN